MKKNALLLFLFSAWWSSQVLAQAPCAFNTDSARNKFAHHPSVWRSIGAQQPDQTHSVVTIPVVVHVIWHDPSENISDAQIFSQLDVLNEDFRKHNADTGVVRPVFASLAGDAQIEFCLAQRDPQGNATNGITRTYSSVPDWSCDDSMKYSANGGADGWPGASYLNIWVCKLNCANGYAYYPGTPDPIDGVVIHYYVFGRVGNVAPGFQGRTCDHEIGHYFGLYHTFDYSGLCEGSDTSNCSSEGDYVCDTPADINPDFGCPPFVNDCADTPVDNPDQTENFMDYGDDGCRVMFSLGQIERMRGYVFTDRISLLTSLACVPPSGNYFDAGLLDLLEPADEICSGTIVPVILVSDISSDTLTSLDVDYSLDTGATLTFSWTGSISAGTSGTISLPAMAVNPGIHALHVTVNNPNGQSDQNIANNTGDFQVEVISSGAAIPSAEGFEAGGFPYPHWSVEDPDHHYGWEHDVLAGAQQSSASMRIRNFYNQDRNTLDGLITPEYNLTGYPAAQLTFDVAYSDPGSTFYSDTLRLLYSLDCGMTWNIFWQDGGLSLSTAPAPVVFSEFVPDSTQWENHQLSLNQFLGAPLLSLKFENKNGWGNDLYIDNINLTVPTGISNKNIESLVFYPDPVKDILIVRSQKNIGAIRVFNIEGELVMEFSGDAERLVSLNVSDLTGSAYIVEVICGEKTFHHIVIKE
jgi:hypothetical protein